MPKPFQKSCGVHVRPESIFVFSSNRTDYGNLSSIPAHRLDRKSTPSEIGAAVLAALADSKDIKGEVNLRQATEAYKTYLKSVGFRSLAAFTKSSCHLHVREYSSKIVIHFWKQEGSAFLPSDRPELEVLPAAEALGLVIHSELSQVGY